MYIIQSAFRQTPHFIYTGCITAIIDAFLNVSHNSGFWLSESTYNCHIVYAGSLDPAGSGCLTPQIHENMLDACTGC